MPLPAPLSSTPPSTPSPSPASSAPSTPLEAIQAELLSLDPENKSNKAPLLHLTVLAALFTRYDFTLVGLGDEPFKAGLRLYSRPHNTVTFVPTSRLALRRLLVEAARSLPTPVTLTGSQVKQVLETFGDRSPVLPTIERRVFQVSDDLYFNQDAEEGQDPLMHEEDLPSSANCFFRLFDSQAEDKDIVTFPASTFDSSFSARVLSAYNSLLLALQRLSPNPEDSLPPASLSAVSQKQDPLPRHFPFIEDWANHNPGLYWDLLTLPATIFMKEKPQISYFLSGTGANGKSAYLGLIHTMLGTRNTTRNRISEMADPHLNTLLQYTLFNAPDDEGDHVFDNENALRIFKSFSSHATVSLPIFYSQEPMELKADFMSAHPLNAAPDWGDISSASALTRRTCLIPFTADFRDQAASSTANFAKATYTPEVMAQFTGEVLALATFYTEHPIRWSDTVRAAHERVEEENDSIRLYRRAWEQFFVSFQSMRLLYDDYRCWCVAHNMPATKDINAFKIHWYDYTSHISKATATGEDYVPLTDENGEQIRRNAASNPLLTDIKRGRRAKGLPPLLNMMDQTVLPVKRLAAYGSIGEMHHIDELEKGVGRTSISAVALMETEYPSGY